MKKGWTALALLLWLATGVGVCQDAPRSLPQLAIEQTRSGDLAGAEETYLKWAAEDPGEGLPSLSRFYSLTNQDQKLSQLLRETAENEAFSIILRTRVCLQAGEVETALDFLDSNLAHRAEWDQETVLFAVDTLKRFSREEAACELLLWAIETASGADQAREPVRRLLGDPTLFLSNPKESLAQLELWYDQVGLSAEAIVASLDAIVFELQRSPNYWERRTALLALCEGEAPLRVLLESIIHYHEGNLNLAERRIDVSRLQSLDLGEAGNAAQAVQLIRSLSDAGSERESSALAAALLLATDTSPAPAHLLEAAKQALDGGQLDQAAMLFQAVAPQTLSGDARLEYDLLELRLAAHRERSHLAEMLQRGALKYGSAEIERMVSAIANEVGEPELLLSLLDDLDIEDSEPTALLLGAEIRYHTGQFEEELKARWQYAQGRLEDTVALERLVIRAIELATTSEQSSLRKRASEIAEAAGGLLVQAKPFSPEPMRLLMEFYRKRGQPDQALEVPAMVGRESTNPQILGNCGYVLATEGHPEAALDYYDRALALDPGDRRVEMNRAAALTRAGRWESASAVFRDVLETGYQGRAFHSHEAILQLWNIALQQDTESETLAYFSQLLQLESLPWKAELFEELISILLQVRNPEAAIEILHRHSTPGSTPWLKACLSIAWAYDAWGETEQGAHFISEVCRLLQEPGDAKRQLEAARVLLEQKAGGEEHFSSLIDQLALNPDDKITQDLVFQSAQVADRQGNRASAVALYQAYLDSHSLQFDYRKRAGIRLSELRHFSQDAKTKKRDGA